MREWTWLPSYQSTSHQPHISLPRGQLSRCPSHDRVGKPRECDVVWRNSGGGKEINFRVEISCHMTFCSMWFPHSHGEQEEPHITIPLSSMYILHFFSSTVKSPAPHLPEIWFTLTIWHSSPWGGSHSHESPHCSDPRLSQSRLPIEAFQPPTVTHTTLPFPQQNI